MHLKRILRQKANYKRVHLGTERGLLTEAVVRTVQLDDVLEQDTALTAAASTVELRLCLCTRRRKGNFQVT